jgi:Arc/MetJ family transcription regulator
MGINISVDDLLLAEAERVTGEHDREKLLEKALHALIKQARPRRPIDDMLDLAGTVMLRDDYDYKAMRVGDRDPD